MSLINYTSKELDQMARLMRAEAFREIRCNGYISKPVDAEQIKEELSHLRLPMKEKTERRIIIQCFGYFAVHIDGKPMEFGSAKTQELFAYLVNACGGTCTNQEIMTYLWDLMRMNYII